MTRSFALATVLAPAAQMVVVQNVAAFRAAFGNGPAVAGSWPIATCRRRARSAS